MSKSQSGKGTSPGGPPGGLAADADAEALVVPEPELQPGERVGEFVVEGKLGEGGFGVVFKAVHPLIGKEVAIKVLNRQYSSNPGMVSRFVAEARAVNQIRHRHIIDIFSFGQLSDGRQYYVMELLAGQPLDQYLAQHGHLSLEEALLILRAVGRALDAAHAKGIAHRDLKPENIFISHDEDGTPFPKLLDFGIAKLMGEAQQPKQHKTRTGAPMGTPYYMSPEQCRGRDIDARTDIYSFGIVAYQLLTGKLPFEGEDFMEILLKQLSEQPTPPSTLVPGLPSGIDRGIAWMMRKDAVKRPPNLATGMRALEDAAAEVGVVLPGPSPRSPERQSQPEGAVARAVSPVRITDIASAAPREPVAELPPSPKTPETPPVRGADVATAVALKPLARTPQARSGERDAPAKASSKSVPTPGAPSGPLSGSTSAVDIGAATTPFHGNDALAAEVAPAARSRGARRRVTLVVGALVVAVVGGGVAFMMTGGRAANEAATASQASASVPAGQGTPGPGVARPVAGALAGATATPPASAATPPAPASASTPPASTPPAPTPPASTPPRASTKSPASPASAAPSASPVAPPAMPVDTITLTIEGVPPGTEVLLPDGVVLGKAPGTLRLVRGDAPVRLTLRARGFRPATQDVTPRADATISVTLKALAPRAGAAPETAAPPLAEPGPKPKPKGKDKESLEDFE